MLRFHPRTPPTLFSCPWRKLLGAAILASQAGSFAAGSAMAQESPQARKALEQEVDALIERRGLEPVKAIPEIRPQLRELGRLLNFDPILSGNRDISCATCHHPSLGTGDGRHLSFGTGGNGLGRMRFGGGIVPRNAPALFNLHAYESMFWDNRLEIRDGFMETPAKELMTPTLRDTMEFGLVSAQAMFPVTSHTEMAGQPGENDIANALDVGQVWTRLTARVLEIPEYQSRLELAYPEQDPATASWNFAHIANALAAFQISAYARMDSPWQRYLQGDKSAMSEKQLRGALTFFETGCASCHSGPMFSDFAPHNSGIAPIGPGKGLGATGIEDWGRWMVTNQVEDKHKFRTAPLVNVELTGPWGHAGQFGTLRSYVEHYQSPADAVMAYHCADHISALEPWLWFYVHPEHDEIAQTLDPELGRLKPFDPEEILDFLGALTDPQASELMHEIPDSVPSGLPMDPLSSLPPSVREPGCKHDPYS